MFSCFTTEFYWIGTLMKFEPRSGRDSCQQRDKNVIFPITLALPERRLITTRNKNAGVKKCTGWKELRAGHEGECAKDQDHKQKSALCQKIEPAASSLQGGEPSEKSVVRHSE